MTDLEAKISSEFADGDPTVQGGTRTTSQPLAMRVSMRRILPVIVTMLIVGGGIITYFASTTDSGNAPTGASLPAAVKAVNTTNTTPITAVVATQQATPVSTGKSTSKTVATPAHTTPEQPTTPATSVTPMAQQPTVVQHVQYVTTNLVESVTSAVGHIVEATISIVL
jgi:hypothetical protein